MLRFVDSCSDPFSAGHKYDQNYGLSDQKPGRYSGLSYPFEGTNQVLTKTFGYHDTWIAGIALYIHAGYTNNVISSPVRFYSGNTPMAALAFGQNGFLKIYRYDVAGNPILVQTAQVPLRAQTWGYVEVKVNAATTGGYTVRLNGQTVLNGTANFRPIDTGINKVLIGGGLSGQTYYFLDDIYMADGADGSVMDFLGDVRVDAYYPIANGSQNDFTPQGAATNWECCDEARLDQDGTYVKASAVGAIDLYDFANIADGTGTVKGVQSSIVVRKDDSGDRQVAPVAKQGATIYQGTAAPLNASFETKVTMFDKAPDGTAWTNTKFNAMQFGVKVAA